MSKASRRSGKSLKEKEQPETEVSTAARDGSPALSEIQDFKRRNGAQLAEMRASKPFFRTTKSQVDFLFGFHMFDWWETLIVQVVLTVLVAITSYSLFNQLKAGAAAVQALWGSQLGNT